MALFVFANLNKHGNVRKRIIYHPTTQFSYRPKGLGKFIAIHSFKYLYEHSFLPPGLITTLNGKKYITPTWQEVHPQTTLKDINWVKPKKITREIPKNTWEFKSSSGDGIYVVKQIGINEYRCNCPGFYRAKDRDIGCKHVKSLKK